MWIQNQTTELDEQDFTIYTDTFIYVGWVTITHLIFYGVGFALYFSETEKKLGETKTSTGDTIQSIPLNGVQ